MNIKKTHLVALTLHGIDFVEKKHENKNVGEKYRKGIKKGEDLYQLVQSVIHGENGETQRSKLLKASS